MSRPALLAVATVPVWPIHDGYSLRVFHLLKALAADWSITLVAPRGATSDEPPAELGLAAFRPVELGGGWTWLPSDEHRAALAAAVDRASAGARFDAALLWSGAEFLGWRPGCPPAVGDRIDCMTMINWRAVRTARGRARLRPLRAAVAFARYERGLVRRLPAITVVGEDDARALRRLGGRGSVHVVPNGVALGAPPRSADCAAEPTVTFTGVMSYPPNVEAATWFARRVWPLVRAAVPGARYRVVGRKPTPAVLALAAEPGVEVVGAVPDMQAELRKAWVAVAPMRDGGGIKNKVLEAWAVGTPVVMTHLAANGLSLDAAAAALVTSVPAVFADRVVALLREPSRRDVLSRAAHELAGREHGWEHAAEQLSRLLRAGAGLPGARREEAGLVVA